MGRKDQGGGRIPVHGEAPRGGGTSLGDLLRKAGLVAGTGEGERARGTAQAKAGAEAEEGAAAGPGAAVDLSRCPKIVLRRERKGHGGRTVTRIEGLDLPREALEDLAREVGRALGCGGRLEDGMPVVSGDPGERLEAWLQERGARKVVRGN